MKYHQRDVVEINFPIPGEGFVYIVMISSKDFAHSRQYSYPLRDEMLSFKMEKPSWVKCHLVAADIESSVIRRLGSVKEEYFNEIVDKIIESIF